MYDATTASKNVSIGYQTLANLTTGDSNVVIGYQASDSLTTDLRNIKQVNLHYKLMMLV